jgi:hypothetical protein
LIDIEATSLFIRFPNNHTTPFDFASAAKDQVNGFRVKPVFLLENSGRQFFDRITLQNRDDGLKDDGTAIQRLIHKVHRAAAEFHSMFESLILDIQSRKRRQKRRVNVQDGMGEGLDQDRAEHSHESGQANQVDLAVPKQIDCSLIEFLSRTPCSWNEHGIQPTPSGLCQTGSGFLVTDDDCDFSFQRSIRDVIGNRLEVGTTP